MNAKPMRKAGRCTSGAERDKGTVWHAVPPGGPFTPALCGTEPGRSSVGWVEPLTTRVEVTCPRCRQKLERSV